MLSDLEGEDGMAAALEIRRDLYSSVELRSCARRERSPRPATRMLAIAKALEGLTRAEAARLAGMERQALRDAVICYNQEGLAGLRDRSKPGRPSTLSEGKQALLRAKILQATRPAGRLSGVDLTGPVRLDRGALCQAPASRQPVPDRERAGSRATEDPTTAPAS